MFDVSFGELLVIGAVTLVVVGPEKMPKVARTAGMLFGRLQRFVNNVKTDLQREMHASELAQIQQEIEAEANEIKNSIHQPLAETREALSALESDYQKAAAHNAAENAATSEPNRAEFELAATPAPAAAELAQATPVLAETTPARHDNVPHNDNQLDLFADLNTAAPSPQTTSDRR